MTKHAHLGFGTSGTVHIGLFAVALAFANTVEMPHFHVHRGTIEIQGTFAEFEPPSEASFTAALSLEPDAAPLEVNASSLSPAATAVMPVKKSIHPTLTSVELPKLPAEIEACQCDSPDHHSLQTPQRRPTDPVQPLAAAEEAAQPRRRTPAVAHVSTPTVEAISLPASAEPAGADFDEPPKKIASNRPPAYPADAYQRRQQGRVLLEAHVAADGTVESLRIIESSGIPSLDQAALDTVRQWRFEPGRRQGRAVNALVNVPVRFAIKS